LRHDETTILDQLAAPVIMTDPRGVITYWNSMAERTFGWRSAEAIGQNIREVLVPHKDTAAEIPHTHPADEVWDGEYPILTKDGSIVVVHCVSAPHHDLHGEMTGFVMVSLDVTDRKRLEDSGAWSVALKVALETGNVSWKQADPDVAGAREAEMQARAAADHALGRLLTLQNVTAALNEATSADNIIEVILEQVHGAFAPRAGLIVLLDDEGENLRIAGSFGYAEELMAEWSSFPLAAPLPLSDAVRKGETVVTRSIKGLKRRYPLFASNDPKSQVFVGVPLDVKGRKVGGLGFGFEDAHDFEDEDIAFVRALGRQCAQALDRMQLYEREREARRRAESAQRNLAFLAEASAILTGSLDYVLTLTRLAKLIVPSIAEWCSIDVLDEEGTTTRSLVVEHMDPSKISLAEELRRRYPPDPDAPTGVANVVRTGRSELHREIPPEMIEAAARDAEHLALLRDIGLSTAMIVPLTARGRTFGAVTMVGEGDRRFDEHDLALAEELARRAALAVDNARLYQERSHVARILQRSLLPPRLPDIPGIEIAARYRPAARDHEVGGDFYDVFQDTLDGWAIAVGDVQGKGAAAAAVTGLARHTLRAAAMHRHEPSEVLKTLNDVLLNEETDRFCTVLYGRLVRTLEGADFTFASGGHPTPYVLRAGGSIEALDAPGMLVGSFPDLDVVDVVCHLGPGDAVVAYTDGVVEERAEGGGLGTPEFERALQVCIGLSSEKIVATIEERVAERSEIPHDDVAVLAFRVL
jgi:PAS domain S-box-containing protein